MPRVSGRCASASWNPSRTEVSIAKTERVSRRPNPVFDNIHLRRSMDGALNLKTVFEARERSRSPVITKTE